MAVAAADAKEIITKAFGLLLIEVETFARSKLKCPKCGANGTLSGSYFVCQKTSAHKMTNKDYIIHVIDMLDAQVRAKNDDSLKGGSTFL